jgi:hypothetical protein
VETADRSGRIFFAICEKNESLFCQLFCLLPLPTLVIATKTCCSTVCRISEGNSREGAAAGKAASKARQKESEQKRRCSNAVRWQKHFENTKSAKNGEANMEWTYWFGVSALFFLKFFSFFFWKGSTSRKKIKQRL